MDKLRLPDTAKVLKAIKLAEATLDPLFLAHSYRTYFFALAYSEKHQKPVDEEELALVSLYHDQGFFAPFRNKKKAFQINSSLALKKDLLQDDHATDRIREMMMAIDYHVKLSTPWDKGNLAALLKIGSHMDVTGSKRKQIPSEARKEILQYYPRGAMLKGFCSCLLRSSGSFSAFIGPWWPGLTREADHYPPKS